MLSVHTSPLAQPGSGDGGGMNVYIRALASSLARAGVAVDVFTRAEHPEQPPVVDGRARLPGAARRRRAVRARPARDAPRSGRRRSPTSRRDRVLERSGTRYDVLHANYWVSGAVGHRLKHELDLPLVTTFHTLERVKAEVGMADDAPLRPRIEAEVVRCADLVVASTRRGARPARALLRRRSRPGRGRRARRRPPRVLARRPRRGAPAARPARSAGAALRRSHPTAQGRRPRDRRARGARTTRAPSW